MSKQTARQGQLMTILESRGHQVQTDWRGIVSSLDMLESRNMSRQTDWQAKQTHAWITEHEQADRLAGKANSCLNHGT